MPDLKRNYSDCLDHSAAKFPGNDNCLCIYVYIEVCVHIYLHRYRYIYTCICYLFEVWLLVKMKVWVSGNFLFGELHTSFCKHWSFGQTVELQSYIYFPFFMHIEWNSLHYFAVSVIMYNYHWHWTLDWPCMSSLTIASFLRSKRSLSVSESYWITSLLEDAWFLQFLCANCYGLSELTFLFQWSLNAKLEDYHSNYCFTVRQSCSYSRWIEGAHSNCESKCRQVQWPC